MVFVLFLSPNHLSLRVFSQEVFQSDMWEWRKLLKSYYMSHLILDLLSILNQVIVHLARTNDQSFRFALRNQLVKVLFWVHDMELTSLYELRQRRRCRSEPEQLFGVEQNERLPIIPSQLSSK